MLSGSGCAFRQTLWGVVGGPHYRYREQAEMLSLGEHVADQPKSVQGALVLSLLSKFAMSFSDGTRGTENDEHIYSYLYVYAHMHKHARMARIGTYAHTCILARTSAHLERKIMQSLRTFACVRTRTHTRTHTSAPRQHSGAIVYKTASSAKHCVARECMVFSFAPYKRLSIFSICVACALARRGCECGAAIDGRGRESIMVTELYGGARIAYIFNSLFAKKVQVGGSYCLAFSCF